MIKFNDGMTFDISGELKIVHKSDGLYVVGDNMLIPVDSAEEGKQLIEVFNQAKEKQKCETIKAPHKSKEATL